MLEIVDFYKVLQVDPQAEPEVVQAAFRSLARKYHPDVIGGSEDRMIALNSAWAVLGDPDQRAAYDRGRGVVRSQAFNEGKDPTRENEMPAAGEPPGPPSGTVLNFGRYAGWSFGQIARHDPDFLEWFARMPIGRPFQNEIDALLLQLPRFQKEQARPVEPKKKRFMRR